MRSADRQLSDDLASERESQEAGPAANADERGLHVEGIAAIMENHFRYEQRRLLTVLRTLELLGSTRQVLGPL